MEITFSNPLFLWFIGFIPLLVSVHFYSLHFAHQNALRFANFSALKKVVTTKPVAQNNYLILVLRVLSLVLFTLAASGVTLHYVAPAPHYDFVVALDTSNSMLAQDVAPSRLSAAKSALTSWLSTLPQGATVGIVGFSSLASVAALPSNNTSSLGQGISAIAPGKSEGRATCEALRLSANTFQNSSAPNAIILISDGKSNSGCLLSEGIDYANQMEITVFSIGVGTARGGTIEYIDSLVYTLDDSDLRAAAELTGGNYSHAETEGQISSALMSLNGTAARKLSLPLDKYAMLAAFLLVFIDWGLSATKYRAIP